MVQLNSIPKIVDEHYEKVSIILINRINKVLKKKGVLKGTPRVLLNYSPEFEIALRILKKEKYLRYLINSDSNVLQNIAYFTIFNLSQKYIKTNNDYKILYNIFVENGYEQKFNKFEFINLIGVETCPYCNRNYIFSVKKNKEIKPEIDHFFPKSIYPFLALSYYNLIPSCQSCNGIGGKMNLDPSIIGLKNPYLLSSKDFKLSFKINNISIINPLCGNSDIEIYFKEKIQSHCEVFNLEDLYCKHNDHALELIIKKKLKYSDKYRKYLNSYEGLKFNKSEIDRMILGNYSLEKEQHKRPLSKLYQDIGIELGLIKK